MQFVKQSHISTGRNWSPQGFVVAHIVTIACVEASCECWCVLGNLATLTCVGECYFGVNFHCVGITNIWPLPRVVKTHAANKGVLSRNALLSVCFYRRADWEWCHWDDLRDLTFYKEIFVQSEEQNTTCQGRSWQAHMMGRWWSRPSSFATNNVACQPSLWGIDLYQQLKATYFSAMVT